MPITLYELNSQVWHVLRRYKDGADPVVTHSLATQAAATLSRFINGHESCLAELNGGMFTLISAVPSTRDGGRSGEHPLVQVIRSVRRLVGRYRPVLERGNGFVDHNQASDEAFDAAGPLDHERVLLLDDTFTSGARLQSAASTLRRAGAHSVTGLVIGRVINPSWNANCQRIWDTATTTGFTFDQCCLCVGRSSPRLTSTPGAAP